MTALHDRDRTGKGQFVDVAMLDGQIAILENAIARYAATGQSPGPLGARHPSITPFAAYSCADAPIVIAAGNDQLFTALCKALGLPEDDPRFGSNEARTTHAEELAAVLEDVLLTKPVAHWLPKLEAAGVPCGPLNNIGQALANPQVKARNMVVHTALPDGTPLIAAGNPIKLSAHADPATRAPAPDLDADRAAILKELGL
jgi:CoA:oxalate CoA-transferase